MEHAFLYRSRVWVAKKKQNARPPLIFPRYQAFSLKGDGSVPRIQLVNRVYIQLLALRVGFANIAGYATILLFFQSSGVNFVDLGIPPHTVVPRCSDTKQLKEPSESLCEVARGAMVTPERLSNGDSTPPFRSLFVNKRLDPIPPEAKAGRTYGYPGSIGNSREEDLSIPHSSN